MAYAGNAFPLKTGGGGEQRTGGGKEDAAPLSRLQPAQQISVEHRGAAAAAGAATVHILPFQVIK